MTQQSGRSGYGSYNGNHEKSTAEKVSELGSEALDRADEWLKPVGLSIKEKPMTCLAVVGGLAFVGGALWMMRGTQRQSHVDQVLGQISDLTRRGRFW
ncbi:MAG TPA: hypothetical protein VHI72_15430 [Hyphomicrobiaceae bacterium]|jgi:hypothetical protein|nr:hypothetical protein [Hyphomicrobiaceae bacterium]